MCNPIQTTLQRIKSNNFDQQPNKTYNPKMHMKPNNIYHRTPYKQYTHPNNTYNPTSHINQQRIQTDEIKY